MPEDRKVVNLDSLAMGSLFKEGSDKLNKKIALGEGSDKIKLSDENEAKTDLEK